jgi:hypothetical protein
MKRAILAGYLGGLLLFPFDIPTADAGGVAGTKERITFEGLVGRHSEGSIPTGYDGFEWGNIEAVGKGLYRDQQGFQSVVHGKAAAAIIEDPYFGVLGQNENALFSVSGGEFAAFGNNSTEVTFKAYKQGVLVGSMTVNLSPSDTLVKFDRIFQHIDKFEIDGVVAMDNLHVRF